MRKILTAFVVMGGLALTASHAPATEVARAAARDAQQQREGLVERSEELQRELRGPIPGGARAASIHEVARRSQIRRQQREIEHLIQRLEAGDRVESTEVERLLGAR